MISYGRFVFFFFKQKTAYEIYQCDWSSDVCSSDLVEHFFLGDILNTDGSPWDCCPRRFLQNAVDDLRTDRKSVV